MSHLELESVVFGHRRPKCQVMHDMRHVGKRRVEVMVLGPRLDMKVARDTVHQQEPRQQAAYRRKQQLGTGKVSISSVSSPQVLRSSMYFHMMLPAFEMYI